MNRLYIIGNGFDLWHGLPTSYRAFFKFAHNDLENLELYFNPGDGEPWHDFEGSLGTYDWQSMYSDYNHIDMRLDSFKPSEFYGLEDELAETTRELVDTVTELFQEWISAIDVSETSKILEFEPSARFINFNYTSTLQTVYGVDASRILHIHGSVEEMSELIFGHGATMDEEPELDENGDSNRSMATDSENAAKFPFHAFKKPTDKVIEKNRGFFESLEGIEEIVVIGHSMNDIDLPYFMEIAKNTRRAKWKMCHHSQMDEKHHIAQLIKCGVTRGSISTCQNEELRQNSTL